MKKLMFAAVAALAMVGAANAAATYNYMAQVVVAPNGTDYDTAHYSFYALTQASAKSAMKTDATVTYDTMAQWLGENFAAAKSSVIAEGQNISTITHVVDEEDESIHYIMALDSKSPLAQPNGSLVDAIAVCFYDDGANQSYMTMASTSDGGKGDGDSFMFIESFTTKKTDWTAATTGGVPEPTSGLLLLLGVAGLALRRKRA